MVLDKYKITIVGAKGDVRTIMTAKVIREARAKAVKYLRSHHLSEGVAFIGVIGMYNSWRDAPGGRIEINEWGTAYFYQDGVAWTVNADGTIRNKEVQ